jgi:uncharacterized SAM-binding protein YcdF (DUF218 family)
VRRGRIHHVVARDLIRLVGAVCLGVALAGGYATYRIWAQGQRDEERPADAIVVMGAAQYDGRPSKVFAARLDHAVALYFADVAPRLVVTGGKAEGDRTTEAAAGRAFAIELGVPPEDILVDDRSRTTLESIRAVAALLDGNNAHSAVFVSDRPHMLRVLRMAADEGMTAWGSPTRTSPIEGDLAGQLEATVHELGALAFYFLTGGSS